MNPQQGLKVHAYKVSLLPRPSPASASAGPLTNVMMAQDSQTRSATDKELKYVKRYLLQLTLIPDWRGLDHKNFRTFVGQLPAATDSRQ